MASAVEERRRPRRRWYVGGYTSSGRDASQLELRGVPGPAPGEKPREPESANDKK